MRLDATETILKRVAMVVVILWTLLAATASAVLACQPSYTAPPKVEVAAHYSVNLMFRSCVGSHECEASHRVGDYPVAAVEGIDVGTFGFFQVQPSSGCRPGSAVYLGTPNPLEWGVEYVPRALMFALSFGLIALFAARVSRRSERTRIRWVATALLLGLIISPWVRKDVVASWVDARLRASASGQQQEVE